MVTVDTVEEIKIMIYCRLEYDNTHSFEVLKEQIEKMTETYLGELRASWGDLGDHGCIIRISQLEARILEIQGIYDISDTKINGTAENLELDKYQIPIYGGIEIDSRS